MKIAIAELEPKEVLSDIGSVAGGEIVGGKTSAAVFTESFAEGDVAVTKSDSGVYTFNFETDCCKYSFSLAFGYSSALSVDFK